MYLYLLGIKYQYMYLMQKTYLTYGPCISCANDYAWDTCPILKGLRMACALVGDPARAVGECKEVDKAQP